MRLYNNNLRPIMPSDTVELITSRSSRVPYSWRERSRTSIISRENSKLFAGNVLRWTSFLTRTLGDGGRSAIVGTMPDGPSRTPNAHEWLRPTTVPTVGDAIYE